MSPRLVGVLEEVRRFADHLHGTQPGFRQLLDRALSENPDRASTAIAQLEGEHDPALAAIAWGFFWIRQGELSQARNELEVMIHSGEVKTFWGGMALLTLGEVCLELGEHEKGLALLRQARQMLGEPP